MKQVIVAVALLFAPVAASAQSVTSPSINGQPYFQVSLTSGNQAVTAATATKVHFNTINFDSGSNYDAVTNFRYTPQVAGKYLVTVNIQLSASAGTSGGNPTAFIYKNGSPVFSNQSATLNTNAYGITQTATALVTLNGTSDFVEGWGSAPGSAGTTIISGATLTYMQAYYVGP